MCDTVTTLTNLPAIPSNWLTAAGIAASALDGKGDWNIGKTGYSLTQTFPSNFSDLSIEVTTGRVDVAKVAGTAQTAGDVAALISTVDTVVDGIQTDLDNATDGLGAIKTDTAAILTDTAEIGAAGAGLTDLGGMSTTMKAEINTEVVDTLNVDTYAEPGQGAPAATTSLAAKIGYLYKAWRNKSEQTASTHSLYDDTGVTVDQKATVSDDGTTATKGEVGSGP